MLLKLLLPVPSRSTAANEHPLAHETAAEFVGAWEEVKAEEARRAEAEAEVFKHKTRSTDIASEEQVGQGSAGCATV